MNEKKIILGIETSCDETAVSIIEEDKNDEIKILSNVSTEIPNGSAHITFNQKYTYVYGDNWKELYKYAIDQGLKFLSFGDAVLFKYK